MQVKGITIHNTGNELSARENYEILFNEGQMNLCHYLVDETEVINTIPESEEAYHTGRGYDFGNRFTIAIEICRSVCNDDIYIKAQSRAIKLIKKLMKKHKLSTNDIYFHSDFNTVKCPHRIIETYETKERFINECIL